MNIKAPINEQQVFEMPKMSWEKPIEETILHFCNEMARQWRGTMNGHPSKKIRENAEGVVMAYETVSRKIKEEIKFRKDIKNL